MCIVKRIKCCVWYAHMCVCRCWSSLRVVWVFVSNFRAGGFLSRGFCSLSSVFGRIKSHLWLESIKSSRIFENVQIFECVHSNFFRYTVREILFYRPVTILSSCWSFEFGVFELSFVRCVWFLVGWKIAYRLKIYHWECSKSSNTFVTIFTIHCSVISYWLIRQRYS